MYSKAPTEKRGSAGTHIGTTILTVEIAYVFAAALSAAALVALVVVAILRRWGAAPASSTDADRVRSLEAEVAVLWEGKAEAERRLAAEQRTAARVSGLEQELGERRVQMDALRDAKAAVEIELSKTKETAERTGEALSATRAHVTAWRLRIETSDIIASGTSRKRRSWCSRHLGQLGSRPQRPSTISASRAVGGVVYPQHPPRQRLDGTDMHLGLGLGVAVQSPCVEVCRMDRRTGWCLGCLRGRVACRRRPPPAAASAWHRPDEPAAALLERIEAARVSAPAPRRGRRSQAEHVVQ